MMVLIALRRQKVCVALKALAGYFSYINTELCLTLFLKKNFFFPSCGNDDLTIYGTCYGQCYGDLYSDTFLLSFLEVFSAEILLLHVREVLRTPQGMSGDPH